MGCGQPGSDVEGPGPGCPGCPGPDCYYPPEKTDDFNELNLAAGTTVMYEVQVRAANACHPDVGADWQRSAREKVEALTRRIEDRTKGRTYGKPYPEWLLLDHERHMLTAESEWMDRFIAMLKEKRA